MEQLGNVGGEVNRALRWHGKDEELFQGAVNRALELLDLTITDPRWRTRLKEICRARELFVDSVSGGGTYGATLEDLNRYFFLFALYARIKK